MPPSGEAGALEATEEIVMNDNQAIKRQSKLGLISFWIGIINILILVYVTFQIAQFLMTQQDLFQNPTAIDGMRISQSTYHSFIGVFLLQILGFVLGLISLFSSGAKRLFPLLGTVINGLLVTFSAFKLSII